MTTLLAANDGGHITQLSALLSRLAVGDDRLWVTVATPQTESMLANERVNWVGPAPTRDWRAAARNARLIHRVLRKERIARAISTGSSLAVSALPQAALRGIPAHYIESVTRTDGYSLAGRMLRCIPGVSLYVQWPHLATGRWAYRGSVFEGFAPKSNPPTRVRRVVVSLGTSGTYGFRRLVDRLVALIPTGVDVIWQTGSTDVEGSPIDADPFLRASQLDAAIAAADVLIAHAGAGIALTALRAGKIPILVPRLASRDEHVDDHQSEIGRRLGDLGLAVVVDADDLSWEMIAATTGLSVGVVEAPAPFQLND